MACSTSSMPMPSSTISFSCEVLFTYMLMHCTANVSPHRTNCRQRTIIMSMSELFIIVSFVKLTTNRLMCGSAISTSSGLTATQKSFAHHAERANEKHRAVSTEVNVHGVRSHSSGYFAATSARRFTYTGWWQSTKKFTVLVSSRPGPSFGVVHFNCTVE